MKLRHDSNTEEILEIWDQQTGATDFAAMQYDVDNGVCKDDGKCKNEADRKMLKSLDPVPYKDKQWSHFLAINMINTKQKHDIGLKKLKKPSSEKMSWQQQLAKELHKPIKRDFT